MKTKIFITGAAGFVGFHLAKLLLDQGCEVAGFDGMTQYYDVSLKKKRSDILNQYEHYQLHIGMLENHDFLQKTCGDFDPDIIIHLAAQAGVRYSLENPRAYIDSNIIGTFNILEIARDLKVSHLLMASTSSVYGANLEMPFTESQPIATPMTIYAATKKANEDMAHSYAHLYKLPTTMFRFFTVYGPWGRPDMALYKFVEQILGGSSIDVYNHGEMYRDFTFIDDLVKSIGLLCKCVPEEGVPVGSADTLSPVAPFRVVNIGNSDRVKLLDFIDAIEKTLGTVATKNFMPMQKGDVPGTWSDTTLLRDLTDQSPNTSYKEGVTKFIDWYLTHTRTVVGNP